MFYRVVERGEHAGCFGLLLVQLYPRGPPPFATLDYCVYCTGETHFVGGALSLYGMLQDSGSKYVPNNDHLSSTVIAPVNPRFGRPVLLLVLML